MWPPNVSSNAYCSAGTALNVVIQVVGASGGAAPTYVTGLTANASSGGGTCSGNYGTIVNVGASVLNVTLNQICVFPATTCSGAIATELTVRAC